MEIRKAAEGDIDGIAVARITNGPAHDDSGASADYCRYLIADGLLLVAVDERVLGYGGAIDIGPARLLADLYVHADAHGRGVGKALLHAVMDGSHHRFTFASNDPAALPLYARAGMRAWWPLLAMSGLPGSLADIGGATVTQIDPADAARFEHRLVGTDRFAEYRYWASRTGTRTVAVERSGVTIAVASVRDRTLSRIEHLVADDADALDAVAAIARTVPAGRLHAYVPGSHHLAVDLMHRGFVVDDTAMYMASSADLVHHHLQVAHPGLG